MNVGSIYEFDKGCFAEFIEIKSPGTIVMQITEDCAWGKKGKRYLVHPAFIGKEVKTK